MDEEEKSKQEEKELDDDNDDFGLDDDDYEQELGKETVLYVHGEKEDYVSLVNASYDSEGWLHKYRDYDCYKKMLDAGKLHYTAARTKIGGYVGSCICLEFDEYAFVASYYVRPEYRHKGIGTELFNQVVNDSLRKKNVGLHGVQEMSSVYGEKQGFSKRASWLVDSLRVVDTDKAKIKVDGIKLTVKDAKEIDLERIINYDAKVAKCRREGFIRHWAVERIDAVCKVLVDSSDEIVGYGCGRLLSIVGRPIFGPIYCDSDDGFKMLFHMLVSCFDEELKEENTIRLFVPTAKSSTVQHLLQDAACFESRGQCVPQFTKMVPNHDINKIYCITDIAMFI